MDYGLTAPTSATDKALAKRPQKGVEDFLFYSYQPIVEVASISFSAAATGTITAVPDIADYLTGGTDLQAYIKRAVVTAAEIKATLDVDGITTAAMAAVATWRRRAWTVDQSYNVPQFLAVDIVPASDELLDAVNSLTSVTGGAAGLEIGILKMPDTWYPVTCKLSASITVPSPETSPIPCGYDPAVAAPLVRPEAGTITVSANHRGVMDGLARLTGIPNISIRVDKKRDGRLVVQRDVVGGCTLKINYESGENDADVVDEATSIFTQFARFI